MLRLKTLALFICSLLVALLGCDKRATIEHVAKPKEESDRIQLDVCELIKNEEIEAAQRSPITDRKSSWQPDAGFRVSQCFYAAAEASKSVSVSLTAKDPGRASIRTPKDFWRETFGSNAEPNDRGRINTPRGKFIPPRRIDGIGDDAYWMAGALYILKGDTYLRISVGGPDNEETKLNKSKALAKKALPRL